MKRKFFLAFAIAAFALTSCEETPANVDPGKDPDEKPEVKPDEDEDKSILKGNLTADLTIEKGSYKLDGPYIVKSGATLTIKPGVEISAIDDDVVDYILVEQGAKINAEGTIAEPIVMTSELKKAGAWGGLHICGRATVNSGAENLSEIGNAPYGGNDDADNSGVLKYIRLEYTGYALDEEHEANGVSFYGVGNGTKVSYLQAYRGSDDGYEFFGGTVNVDHLIATSCSDDSFDWTDGWRGKAQFLVAYHEAEDKLGYVCDCLMECDNNGDNNSITPMSHPIISNVTLVGNGSATKKDGVMLKAGTEVELYNAIITGKVNPITTKTEVTENALKANKSKLENVFMTGKLNSTQGIYTSADFVAEASNAVTYVNGLKDNFKGIIAGGKAPADDFFEAVDYKGAVDPADDWTLGWAINGEKAVVPVNLEGDITSDITVPAFTTSILSGPVTVKDGATLTIEEGAKIVAVDDDIVDYLIIEQGGKINAQGTAKNPIIMTSEREKAGAWGGLHICGKATVNSGTENLSEIGNAPYGGNDDADNSGVLKYVRLEYTGFAFDEEHEANGISFYGVGNGTEVSYVQAYRGSDDGFEFFGGTVNVKNMVATSCSDDSFDWTDGWRGKAQFLVAYHEAEDDLGYVCDCLMECDNNGDNNSITPMSHPIIANVTLVGNGSSTKKDGIMLKAGTQVELYNAIITGKVNPISTKTTVTENALVDKTSILKNIAMTGSVNAKEGIYSTALFTAEATNSTDYVNALTDKFVGTVAGGAVPEDKFFVATDYKGAVDAKNNWTEGWVK